MGWMAVELGLGNSSLGKQVARRKVGTYKKLIEQDAARVACEKSADDAVLYRFAEAASAPLSVSTAGGRGGPIAAGVTLAAVRSDSPVRYDYGSRRSLSHCPRSRTGQCPVAAASVRAKLSPMEETRVQQYLGVFAHSLARIDVPRDVLVFVAGQRLCEAARSAFWRGVHHESVRGCYRRFPPPPPRPPHAHTRTHTRARARTHTQTHANPALHLSHVVLSTVRNAQRLHVRHGVLPGGIRLLFRQLPLGRGRRCRANGRSCLR